MDFFIGPCLKIYGVHLSMVVSSACACFVHYMCSRKSPCLNQLMRISPFDTLPIPLFPAHHLVSVNTY
jgi:hypothetical protein